MTNPPAGRGSRRSARENGRLPPAPQGPGRDLVDLRRRAEQREHERLRSEDDLAHEARGEHRPEDRRGHRAGEEEPPGGDHDRGDDDPAIADLERRELRSELGDAVGPISDPDLAHGCFLTTCIRAPLRRATPRAAGLGSEVTSGSAPARARRAATREEVTWGDCAPFWLRSPCSRRSPLWR